MKTVVQLDAAGYFVGAAVADESPKEPGIFHLPGGCVDVSAPTIPEGQRARWVAGAWQFEATTAPPDDEPAPETIEQWRARASVSRFQARAALHLAGHLATVQALMDAPEADPMARLAWQDAQEFRRMSPTVLGMGAALGLTDLQLDGLFIQAATISA